MVNAGSLRGSLFRESSHTGLRNSSRSDSVKFGQSNTATCAKKCSFSHIPPVRISSSTMPYKRSHARPASGPRSTTVSRSAYNAARAAPSAVHRVVRPSSHTLARPAPRPAARPAPRPAQRSSAPRGPATSLASRSVSRPASRPVSRTDTKLAVRPIIRKAQPATSHRTVRPAPKPAVARPVQAPACLAPLTHLQRAHVCTAVPKARNDAARTTADRVSNSAVRPVTQKPWPTAPRGAATTARQAPRLTTEVASAPPAKSAAQSSTSLGKPRPGQAGRDWKVFSCSCL